VDDRKQSPGKNYLPTEKDFSGGAVQKVVFKETIQNPATIIPLGIAGGVTGLMVLGLMVVTPITLILPLAAGLVGGGAWVYNYSVRGKEIAVRYIQGLREQLEQSRQQELSTLRQECHESEFSDGYKETGELEKAYLKIRAYLEKKSQSGQELDAARYQSLAKDIYREGIKLLRSALEAHKALQTIDIQGLKKDKDSYEKQLGKKGIGEAEVKSLGAKIRNHNDRIEICTKHEEAVHQLMAQIEELEGVLENSYLELVDLSQGRGLTSTSESVSRLERAVQAARKVEAMLRGEDTSAEDQVYLEAGEGRKS